MASVGTLSIDFAASVARLETDVRKAGKSVEQVSKQIDGAATFAKSALTAMAGALGAYSLGAAIREASAAADAAAKMGDRFGLATEKMVGLQHAASLAGVSNESLGNALKSMTNNVAEAALKSGAARDALASLNLSARELSALPVDQQLARMVDRLGEVENVTLRNKLAQDVFGRAAGEVMGLVADGSAGLEKATRDAEAWGTALNRIDAAKIEMANDATTRAREAMRGIFTTISVQVAPIIKTLADAFADNAAEAKGFKTEAVTGAGFIAQALGYAGNAVHALRLVWASAKHAAAAFFDAIIQGVAAADRLLTDWQNKLAGSWIGEKLGIARAEYSEGLQLFAEVSRDQVTKLMAEHRALLDAGFPADRIIAKFEAIKAAMDREATEIAKRRQQLGMGGGEIDERPGKGGGVDKDAERAAQKAAAEEARWQQDLAKRLERLQIANLSEAELANQNYLQQQNTLDLALQQKFLSEEQHRQMSLQAELQYQAALGDAWAQGLIERERFAKLTTTQQTQHVLGSLMQMTQGVAQSNKQMFAINKAASIATAVVNTYTGATKALAQGGFFGIFLMAATIAAGLAQVQQIRSQQFNGGGAASVSTAAAPSAALAESRSAFQSGTVGGDMAPANAQKAAATQPRNITIMLESDSGQVSTEWVAKTLMPKINELVGAGFELSAST